MDQLLKNKVSIITGGCSGMGKAGVELFSNSGSQVIIADINEEAGINLENLFKGGKARYEQSPDEHHDHLIDINSGAIIEFVDKDIEKLQNEVAKKLGYKLVDHKLELYGSKIKK